MMKRTKPTLPDTQETAILLSLLAQEKERETGKELLRLRVSALTVRRISGRDLLRDEFLDGVREWLARAGWTFFYAGGTFAMLRSKVVKGWPRVSSGRLRDTLSLVMKGEFDFSPHYHLLGGDGEDRDEE